MNEQQLQPVAVILHTRDGQDDYRWFPATGSGQLADVLKELHRGLIADQDAKPASTFLLLDEGRRIGLLVANLKTGRRDHVRTCIYDTLVLEFEVQDREAVYSVAGGLLIGDAPAIRFRLLEYAERQFLGEAASGGTPDALGVPPTSPVLDFDGLPEVRVGLRSSGANQRRVAGLLHSAARTWNGARFPFILVSTGFVGRDRLEQESFRAKRFIALTRSSSFPNDDVVALGSIRGEEEECARVWARASFVAVRTARSLVRWALSWSTPCQR